MNRGDICRRFIRLRLFSPVANFRYVANFRFLTLPEISETCEHCNAERNTMNTSYNYEEMKSSVYPLRDVSHDAIPFQITWIFYSVHISLAYSLCVDRSFLDDSNYLYLKQ